MMTNQERDKLKSYSDRLAKATNPEPANGARERPIAMTFEEAVELSELIDQVLEYSQPRMI